MIGLVPNNPPNYAGETLPTWAKGDMPYGNPDGTILIVSSVNAKAPGPLRRTHNFQMPDRSI